jgi:CheY-like chemotaxis protein
MGRLRVLLIDDEPTILRAYKRAFSACHDVVFASDGREALETIRERSEFDLVVCDITMPVMNGLLLFERVRSECPRLAERFVFATAGSPQRHVEDFLATVPNRVLEKPFEMRLLRELVAGLQGHLVVAEGEHALDLRDAFLEIDMRRSSG